MAKTALEIVCIACGLVGFYILCGMVQDGIRKTRENWHG